MGGVVGALTGCGDPMIGDSDSETSDGCIPGDLDCVCTDAKTCTGDLVCASNKCISIDDPTTGATLTETTSDTSTVGPTTETDTTETTDPTSETSETTTENPGCEENSDCSEEGLPYCSDGACVSCVDLAANGCEDISQTEPACDGVSGQCVPCTAENDEACTDEGLICNIQTNACEPCSAHGQCDSGACDIKEGACFPTGGVWVDKTADCGVATGTVNNPFCEIADAIAPIGANTPTIIWIRPTGTYSKPATISNRIVALIRAPEDNGRYQLTTSGTDSPMSVIFGARVYIDNLDVTSLSNNAPAPSIRCDSSEMWLTNSTISEGKSQGIAADGCTSRVENVSLYDNHRGGLEIIAGNTEIINSFIVDNGGSQGTPISGMSVTGNAAVSLLYTTVAFNEGVGPINPDVMICGPSVNVTVRNSILLGRGYADLIQCEGLTVNTSVLDDGDFAGNDNSSYNYELIAMSLNEWFKNPDSGDYHLAGSDVFQGVAVWLDDDPAMDFDGDARPEVDSTADYPGADVP